jgi:3',5'-cyclic AMP phosphodiesterase CpdA
VNDVLASGAPDWSTWSAEVTLVAGENTITVVATDNAGNVATETITVYRVEPFTFVHMTDVHIGDHWVLDDECRSTPESIEKFTDTLQAIKTEDPEFILSPGDLVEWNKPDYFKAYMNILKSIDDIPVYNTPGNHDRRTWLLGGDDNLAMYYTYVTNPPNTSLNDGHRGYYFDKHGYRFIGLDTGADYNVSTSIKEPYYDYSPEGNGLKNIQLDKLSEMPSGIPKIIFMHHPAIGDGDDMLVDESPEYPITNDCLPEYGGNDACIAFHRCEFIKYCIDNNVDMVLTGHTHRDYDKTVSNELETHKTWFIQTRSATKDPEPCNHHGYRVIKITDEGIIPHMSEMTENTLKNIKRYTYIGGYFPGGVCYVRKGSDITGMDKSGDIMREIPESYYTEPIGLEYQVIVCYNSEPDEYRWCRRVSAGTSQTVVTQESTSSNITIKHRTESTTTKYIYENITLGTAENATIGINFSSENINYTMEFDDNGDGTIDNTTEPTRIIINHAPNVSIATPAGDQSGNVIISYNLVDAESDNCTIITQYSLDNTTWLYAGVGEGGDGMIDVASTPVGVDHTFVWASGTDLPHTNATVYFRIRPYDGDLAGDYATTDAFFVDNRVVPGDLNHDGILTPADAAIALELAAIGGWDPVADVNNDSHITSLDALMILQAAAETQT